MGRQVPPPCGGEPQLRGHAGCVEGAGGGSHRPQVAAQVDCMTVYNALFTPQWPSAWAVKHCAGDHTSPQSSGGWVVADNGLIDVVAADGDVVGDKLVGHVLGEAVGVKHECPQHAMQCVVSCVTSQHCRGSSNAPQNPLSAVAHVVGDVDGAELVGTSVGDDVVGVVVGANVAVQQASRQFPRPVPLQSTAVNAEQSWLGQTFE